MGSFSDEAVMHMYRQIQTRAHVRYHLGYATEAFHLITNAVAAITNKPIDEVQAKALPRLTCVKCGGPNSAVQRMENGALLVCCAKCEPGFEW